jgi:hypothetical protein
MSAAPLAALFSAPHKAEAATTKVIFLTTTGAGTWVVPSDWNSVNNSIECIGAGASGSSPNESFYSAGGGGGRVQQGDKPTVFAGRINIISGWRGRRGN